MKKEDVKVKKLNNKGFSLVEIIIVIAIMAVLAGALAPQLIKYIDKSRKSADIQTAQTIATAVSTALAEEDNYEVASSTTLSACYAITPTPNKFQEEIQDILGGATAPKPKYRSTAHTDFYIKVDNTDKSFKIYAGATEPDATNETKLILYPTVGSDYK